MYPSRKVPSNLVLHQKKGEKTISAPMKRKTMKQDRPKGDTHALEQPEHEDPIMSSPPVLTSNDRFHRKKKSTSMSTKNKPIKRPTVVLDFHALNQEKENSNSNNDSGDDKQVELLKDTKGEASPKISEEI